MRAPLSSCCKNPRSPPCAEVDASGCIKGIVTVFRIAGLMRLVRAPGGDERNELAETTSVGSLFSENLLEKG